MHRLRALAAVLPGLAALVCAVLGVGLLAGWPWALIAAVPFLIAVDYRMTDPVPAANQGDV